jgi:RNA polymerase sigma-70 factor (ECF subfamily)
MASGFEHLPQRGRFSTTHWSVVLAAGSNETSQSREALARLCQLYWYPVYAFIRRQEHSADDAADLTQEFFVRVLDKSFLKQADPQRGRFRSFLLACVRHFLSNEADRARALKRGGGYAILPLEIETGEQRYQLEPRDELTPDKVFDRRWTLMLLESVLGQLRTEQIDRGKEKVFEELKEFLTGESDRVPYSVVGRSLDMSEDAVKVAVHRLRKRFRELLTAEVAQTVSDPKDVRDEIRYLIESVRGT